MLFLLRIVDFVRICWLWEDAGIQLTQCSRKRLPLVKNEIIWKSKSLITLFHDFRKLYLINVNLKKKKSREGAFGSSLYALSINIIQQRLFFFIFKGRSALTRPPKAVHLFNLGKTWQDSSTKVTGSNRMVNLLKVIFLLWVYLFKVSILIKNSQNSPEEKC